MDNYDREFNSMVRFGKIAWALWFATLIGILCGAFWLIKYAIDQFAN